MRRNHKKSHFGCTNCKRRKVKCDEKTPACGSCVRRKETCSYLEVTLPGSSKHTPENLPLRHGDPTPFGHTPQTLLEIELTHFFLIETLPSILFSPTRREVWCRYLFPSSLTRWEKLNAQLATAAMHKVAITEDPEDRAKYLHFASEVQSSVLSQFIPMLSNPSEETASSLFALAALIIVWCFASRCLPTQLNIISRLPTEEMDTSGETTDHGYISDLISIAKISRGIDVVRQQCQHWLYQQGLAFLLRSSESPTLPAEDGCSGIDKFHQFLQESLDDETELDAYAVEIERIKYYMERTASNHDKEVVIGWPMYVNQQFLDASTEKQPPALVILGYWAACLHTLDEQWWAHGWARGLLYEIQSLLNDSWKRHLVWPMKRIANLTD